ncbi:MAG TPA: hypothetical protein VL325_07815, partial [Pyrinomonadaceae bacterium]|nr:hypothetical protein [Pyrinomonadaceae bacterium]
LVVGLVLSQFANGQTPVGEPRPVVVVNSASSPVPVTGTVTGTVEISNHELAVVISEGLRSL